MAFLTKNNEGVIVAVHDANPVTLDDIQGKIDYYTDLKNQYITLAGGEATPATPAAPATSDQGQPTQDQPAQTIPAVDQSTGQPVNAGGTAVTPSVDLSVAPAAPVQPGQPIADVTPAAPAAPVQPTTPQQFPQ